jgi:hypothetical protein
VKRVSAQDLVDAPGDSTSPTRTVRLPYPAAGVEVVVLLYEKEAACLARITWYLSRQHSTCAWKYDRSSGWPTACSFIDSSLV